jgi:micrococcal nuclease
LSPPEASTVAAVLDGETLKLTDGRTVRLIGAKAPMPPLGWRGDDPWPLVDEAKHALSALAAAGKTVELRFGGLRQDRHGHVLAQVFVVEGENRLWLQEALVAKGLARVYSFSDNRACVAELLAREQEARAKRLGVWRPMLIASSRRSCEGPGPPHPSYQLIERTVVAVGEGGGRLYLNFTKDWRSDFTVSVDRKNASVFAAAGVDLKGLAGKRLRVRGFLAWRNGPTIEATHPEQIELLPDNPHEENAKSPERQTGPAIAL